MDSGGRPTDLDTAGFGGCTMAEWGGALAGEDNRWLLGL
jgi:hypothetical protein